MNKTDARILKTRRDLRAALVKLLQEKDFDKITVSDVCAEAMVNRMTFYKHYKDKYDLLNEVILSVKTSIISRMEKDHPDVKLQNDTLEFTFCLIEAIIDECLDKKAVVASINDNELVLTMISTTIEKSVSELLKQLDEKHPLRYPIEMLSVSITGAASFLVRHWLNRQPEKTKEQFLRGVKIFFNDLFASQILFKQGELKNEL
ncbi:MAG: TetR/AcrR family transcriptional regulator [Candidatus Neoclostridium sp.]